MNKEQDRYYRMQIKTQAYLDGNTQKWSNIPRFVAHKNLLDGAITRANELAGQVNLQDERVTQRKDQLKESIAIKLSGLSGILQSYAHETGNKDLLDRISYSKSEIKKEFESNVQGIANVILTEARNRLAELTDFGVTAENLTEVQTTVDEFNSLVGKPRVIQNNKFAAINSLDAVIKEGNDVINKNIDKMMLMFRDTDSSFYNEYQRARSIDG